MEQIFSIGTRVQRQGKHTFSGQQERNAIGEKTEELRVAKGRST
jgi:hypothetical protein